MSEVTEKIKQKRQYASKKIDSSPMPSFWAGKVKAYNDVLGVLGEWQKQLRELWKQRPSHKWMINNLDKIEVVEVFIQKVERELGLK